MKILTSINIAILSLTVLSILFLIKNILIVSGPSHGIGITVVGG